MITMLDKPRPSNEDEPVEAKVMRVSKAWDVGASPCAGQVLAIMALVLVGLLAMVALVIDGGNAYAQQRATQNGTDAAAEAGAVVLAHRLVGTTITDAMVLAAVNDVAADNSVAITSAEYTDLRGNGLGVFVGGGTVPGTAAGVTAQGARTFDTFLGSVVGITELTASTQATAVSGYKKTTCDVTEGCALLPLTPPINETTCSASPALPVTVGPEPHPWPEDPTVSIIPLCSSGAGNVGWIDWSFAFDGSPNGGTSATIASTITPDNPPLTFPTWVQISQAGNTSAAQLEEAINRYSGQPVLVPIFSHTCGSDPVPPYETVGNEPGATEGCLANLDDGAGTQMWYYLSDIDALLLCGAGVPGCDAAPTWTHGAYLSGSSNPGLYCGTSGGTGCIVGKWVDGFVSPGAIDANYTGGGSLNSGLTVQLIR